MLAEITYLREVAQKCRSGAALEPKLASWLGSCLENYLNHRARDMDDAFSLRNGRGGVPWWMEEALHKRDAALRKLSESHFIGLSPTACARKIRESSERYAASSWRFDQKRPEMPKAYKGTPKQYLWKAFQSGAPMPIGERQLRAILSTHSKRSESQVRKFNAFPISNVRCQNDHVEATSI
jgi:hypothetical protein